MGGVGLEPALVVGSTKGVADVTEVGVDATGVSTSKDTFGEQAERTNNKTKIIDFRNVAYYFSSIDDALLNGIPLCIVPIKNPTV